ncbi:MAG TPA: ATP-binding protein, partial [Stenomitos sp.]
MTAPGTSPSFWNQPDPFQVDDAEAQLQQELRAIFRVDTQQYLQDYFRLAQQLNPASWVADIQHIYRAVHTIKGGAVTVEADAMLHTAMVLEDLLSDLRYLEKAPDLSDGQLGRMLLEAGDLLTSSLDISATGAQAIAQIQPTVQRILQLHEQIKQRYLPDWNELKQVHQEFAEQGFDLVVLELEMALNTLPPQGDVPEAVKTVAQRTIEQLIQIGQDLQFAAGWTTAIEACQSLTDTPHSEQWRGSWPHYFQVLKDCAKQGGELGDMTLTPALPDSAPVELAIADPIPQDLEVSEPSPAVLAEIEPTVELETLLAPLGAEDSIEAHYAREQEWDSTFDLEDLSLLAAISEAPKGAEAAFVSLAAEEDALLTLFPDAEALETPALAELDELATLEHWLDDTGSTAFDADEVLTEQPLLPLNLELTDLEESTVASPLPVVAAAEQPTPLPTPAAVEPNADQTRSLQVPVPLERLDRSAQSVVETLLAARAVKNSSQKLQLQLSQLSALSQESGQFLARLRQLQDDYALLRTLTDEQDSGHNLPLERYRQGYTTLNRLLENILRMSELGQEVETVRQQAANRLEALDRSVLKLKDGIETSRLVPFRNLGLRSRAIVRDLVNRYHKPAELVVEGEQVELDAGILQQLEPALLHLLRNAYDHGLEDMEARLQQGKPPQGTICITLRWRGNLYRVSIQDDGAGIDAAAIYRLARQKGFTVPQTQTSADLLAILCQPGFSSRSDISEVSGRGVGMDVVAQQIAAVGGKLSLATTPGQGTTFTIEVPAPQLLVPCVLLQVGDRTVALPAEDVLETVLLSSVQVESAADTEVCAWTLTTRNGEAPGFDLAHYWQQALRLEGQGKERSLPETAIAMRTRGSGDGFDDSAPIWFIA